MIDNKESLTASCSWDGVVELSKIKDIEEEFLNTFNGDDESVIYLDASQIKTRLTTAFKDKELTELLTDEYNILEKRKE